MNADKKSNKCNPHFKTHYLSVTKQRTNVKIKTVKETGINFETLLPIYIKIYTAVTENNNIYHFLGLTKIEEKKITKAEPTSVKRFDRKEHADNKK